MRTGVVFDLVLDELKTRQADTIERLVIRSAGVRHRKRLRTEVCEWCEPCFEVRSNRRIALHVNAADLSRPVVEIVVGRELVVVPGLNELTRLPVLTARPFTEMLFDVFARPDQSLLFTAPQRDADRSSRFQP